MPPKSQNRHHTLLPLGGPHIPRSRVKTLQILLSHHHVCRQGRPWAYGVVRSTSLFLSSSDFVAVRRNVTKISIPSFSCGEP